MSLQSAKPEMTPREKRFAARFRLALKEVRSKDPSVKAKAKIDLKEAGRELKEYWIRRNQWVQAMGETR